MRARGARRTAVLLGALALAAAAPPAQKDRLAALRPDRPMDYFEFAEEIADAPGDAAQRDLARTLFALAGALDPRRLGRSACLALADLEPDENARRRLDILADLLDERAAGGGREPDPPEWAGRAAALAVSEALGHYRRGEGSKAVNRINAPGAAALLDACGAAVVRGGAARFVEECKTYRGARRPAIAATDVLAQLRLEAALLAGEGRSWSQDLLIGGGRPLLEVDPDRLADSLGADPAQACWRGGRWQRCE
jgi:hypothetical protein